MEKRPDPQPLQDATRAGVSRLRILQLLRESPGGLGVQELAEHVGLHTNTVRFHLDRMVTEELVLRHVEGRTDPGRPRLVFTAAPGPNAQAEQRDYRLLAEVLASYVSGTVPDAAAAATEAGRTWGRYLVERPAPYRRLNDEEAVTELLRTLGEIGFAPDLSHDESGQVALMRHCPFLEIAEANREVVCSVHLDLMQGALAEMQAPVTTDRLRPFAEPSVCVAHLAEAGPPRTRDT